MQFHQGREMTDISASEEEGNEPDLLGADASKPPHPHQAPHNVCQKDPEYQERVTFKFLKRDQ